MDGWMDGWMGGWVDWGLKTRVRVHVHPGCNHRSNHRSSCRHSLWVQLLRCDRWLRSSQTNTTPHTPPHPSPPTKSPSQTASRPLTRHVGLPPLLCQPKVAELALRHLVADAHEDVGTLEVKVDDLLGVEVVQALLCGGWWNV